MKTETYGDKKRACYFCIWLVCLWGPCLGHVRSMVWLLFKNFYMLKFEWWAFFLNRSCFGGYGLGLCIGCIYGYVLAISSISLFLQAWNAFKSIECLWLPQRIIYMMFEWLVFWAMFGSFLGLCLGYIMIWMLWNDMIQIASEHSCFK